MRARWYVLGMFSGPPLGLLAGRLLFRRHLARLPVQPHSR